jgi:hypothetical protein
MFLLIQVFNLQYSCIKISLKSSVLLLSKSFYGYQPNNFKNVHYQKYAPIIQILKFNYLLSLTLRLGIYIKLLEG